MLSNHRYYRNKIGNMLEVIVFCGVVCYVLLTEPHVEPLTMNSWIISYAV